MAGRGEHAAEQDGCLTRHHEADEDGVQGCIAGALSFEEYRRGLQDAGFLEVTIEPTHAVADGMHGALIRARRPG